jgi:hypothetical protein
MNSLPDSAIELNRVGRQQLIVAERGANGACVFVVFKPGFNVVGAVSGCLEAVDAHHLVPGQPGSERHPGIGAFELVFGLRQQRDELEFVLGRRQKNGDDRHVDRMRRRFRLDRIARPRRPGIDRRLLEHVVVDCERFSVRALGVAQLPLRGDRAPVGVGRRDIGFMRAVILFQQDAILLHRRRSILQRRGLRAQGRRRHGETDRQQIGRAVV